MNWINVTNVMLTNVFVYCAASKGTLLMWHITSADPPDIVFVELFRDKYLLAMDKYYSPAHTVQRKHLMRN